MGFRFFRRMKIAPGVSLNFSKSGVSPSFGVPGARVTLGRQGVRRTVGIPGTGLFYTELDSRRGGGRSRRGRSSRRESSRAQPPAPTHDLDPGFFKRLLLGKHEEAFIDGCRTYIAGRRRQALEHFENADGVTDADFLAGFLLIDAKRLPEARDRLRAAVRGSKRLNASFAKYGLDLRVLLPITEDFTAIVAPTLRGCLLGLAEIHQLLGEPNEAAQLLRRLRRQTRDDVVVNLSLNELELEMHPDDKRAARRVVEIAGDVDNESEAHAALMLLKGRALRTLDMPTAARDTLTAALRRKKDRSDELLRAIRYERAHVYRELGKGSRFRAELERLFAEDPGYEDVADLLGV